MYQNTDRLTQKSARDRKPKIQRRNYQRKLSGELFEENIRGALNWSTLKFDWGNHCYIKKRVIWKAHKSHQSVDVKDMLDPVAY